MYFQAQQIVLFTRWLYENLHVYMCLHYRDPRSFHCLKKMVECGIIIITHPSDSVDPPPSAFCLRACHYYSDQQAMRPSFSYNDFTSGHKSAKQCRCSDSRCKLFGARTPERLPSLPPSPVVPFVNLHCLSFHSIGTKHLE